MVNYRSLAIMQHLTRVPEEPRNNPYPDGKLPESLKRHVFFGGIGNGQPKKKSKRAKKRKKK